MFLFFCSIFFSLVFISLTFFSTRLCWLSAEERPFECGLNSGSYCVIPFSFQFLLVAILFLIFDVEISLIVPFSLESWGLFSLNNVFFILLLLLFGLWYEWKGGKILWTKWMINFILQVKFGSLMDGVIYWFLIYLFLSSPYNFHFQCKHKRVVLMMFSIS